MFLERRGLEAQEGSIIDEDGQEIGKHGGYWRFTPGQRKGLGVAAQEPLYAIRSDATTNTVVVGRLEALARTTIEASGDLYVPAEYVQAKLRYRSDAAPAHVHLHEGGFRLELDRPAYGVAPGQAAVLYEDDVVVGAGLIQA
jgi:tRNA-specific 2-thiouridylase